MVRGSSDLDSSELDFEPMEEILHGMVSGSADLVSEPIRVRSMCT